MNTGFTEYYGCGIKDDRIDLSEHQKIIDQIHSHYQGLLNVKQQAIEHIINVNPKNINRGDLKKVAQLTGFSHSLVKKVSSGTHKNLTIQKAIHAISEKRNTENLEMIKNLKTQIKP